MFISEDAGQTWRGALPFTSITAIAADHADPYQVYVGVRDFNGGRSGVMLTRDRGMTWEWVPGLPLRDAPRALAAHPGDAARLYAASGTLLDAPSLMHLTPSRSGTTRTCAPSFASYLSTGRVADVAIAPQGESVVVLSDATSRDAIIIRMGRGAAQQQHDARRQMLATDEGIAPTMRSTP